MEEVVLKSCGVSIPGDIQHSTGCRPEQPAAVCQSTLSRGGWTGQLQSVSFNRSVTLWVVSPFLRSSDPRLSESCKWSVTMTLIISAIWLHHQARTAVKQLQRDIFAASFPTIKYQMRNIWKINLLCFMSLISKCEQIL